MTQHEGLTGVALCDIIHLMTVITGYEDLTGVALCDIIHPMTVMTKCIGGNANA